MHVERADNSLVETKLPDGSRVVVDTRNDAVIAMNASAGVAWEACSQPTTLSAIAAKMEGAGLSADSAEDAVFQLHDKKLVTTSQAPSRRTFMAGMAAVPIVAAMSLAEQKVFAERCGSLDKDHDDHHNHGHHYDPPPPHDPEHFKLH